MTPVAISLYLSQDTDDQVSATVDFSKAICIVIYVDEFSFD